jgi:hypothetical protein
MKTRLTVAGLMLASLCCVADEPKTLKVEARTNTTKTPMQTGVTVKSGQKILIEPNPKDQWHSGEAYFDYRGAGAANGKSKGKKKGKGGAAHMALVWGINGADKAVDSDHMLVTADKDGELWLACAEGKGNKDNSGFVRVTVTVNPK